MKKQLFVLALLGAATGLVNSSAQAAAEKFKASVKKVRHALGSPIDELNKEKYNIMVKIFNRRKASLSDDVTQKINRIIEQVTSGIGADPKSKGQAADDIAYLLNQYDRETRRLGMTNQGRQLYEGILKLQEIDK